MHAYRKPTLSAPTKVWLHNEVVGTSQLKLRWAKNTHAHPDVTPGSYNENRPHGAICNKTPITLMNPGGIASLSP